MSVEDAAKVVISAGMVTPDSQKTDPQKQLAALAAMAQAAEKRGTTFSSPT